MFYKDGEMFEDLEDVGNLLKEEEQFVCSISEKIMKLLQSELQTKENGLVIYRNVMLTVFVSYMINAYEEEDLLRCLFRHFYVINDNIVNFLRNQEKNE